MGKATAKKSQEIGMVKVTVDGCRCRCGHEWVPRVEGERPSVCPKCKSPRWDQAKLWERAK